MRWRSGDIEAWLNSLPIRATNLVDQNSFYVSVSRARELVAIYTNDRAKLVTAINERAGSVLVKAPAPSDFP